MNEKKILLANIGNRNITYKEKTIPIKDFKAETKRILENPEEWEHVEPQLLDPMLDLKKGEIEKVILFSSDQKSETRTNQDTLYEGELLCKLYKNKYPEIEFENQVLTCSITNNDQLLRTFRGKLKAIKKTYPDRGLMVFDTGGTAQLKSSLKIMTEFLFDKSQFEMWYVPQEDHGKSGSPEKIPHLEYKNIISEEQARSLAQMGNFQAARDILPKGPNQLKYKILDITAKRIENLHGDFSPNSYADVKEDSIRNYCKKIPLGEKSETFKPIFKKGYFELCELLAQADYYYLLKNYTQAVLKSNIFVESYLHFFLSIALSKSKKKHNYKDSELNWRIVEEVNNNHPDIKDFVKSKYDTYDVKGGSIPVRILLSEKLCDVAEHIKMISSFKCINSTFSDDDKGLDSYRNKIAHEGKGVDKETVGQLSLGSKLELWKSLLGMTRENVYVQTTKLLENLD